MNNELRDKAVAKITDECKDKEYLIPFEEYLTSICNTDAIANKILDEKKTLKDCFEKMQGIAKGRAKNGCAYIPPDEGFSIIEEYYEITPADKKEHTAKVVDLADFF